jgi:hypothetical protein
MIHHKERESVERLARLLREAVDGLWEPYSPPTDPYVAQLVRDIRGGRVKPLDMLASLYVAAVRDGRPAAKLDAITRVLADYVSAHRRPAPSRPLALLHRLETQKDAQFDIAQMREMTEQSTEARRQCLHALREYREVLNDVEVALQREVFREPAEPSYPTAA